MKVLIVLIGYVLFSIGAPADDDPKVTTDIDKDGFPRIEESKKSTQLREYFSKLPTIPFARLTESGAYDLTDVWKALAPAAEGKIVRMPDHFKSFYLEGHVFQVLSSGLLIQKESGDLVFLKNYSLEKRVVDGDAVVTVGVYTGRYQYSAVNGAARAVPKMDCGRRITSETVPSEISRVTNLGTYRLKNPN